MRDEADFLCADKQKDFLQVYSMTLGVRTLARHAQNTQYNKSTISLQYLKENMKDEAVFLLPDKL